MFYAFVLTPLAVFFGWLNSVSFVASLSLIALIEPCLAAWRADVPNKGGSEVDN
jgi:hypothetical protein